MNFNSLSSNNIDIILQNLSCCIANKTKLANDLLLQGNFICYNKEIKDLIFLESVYVILNNSTFKQKNYIYSISVIITFPNDSIIKIFNNNTLIAEVDTTLITPLSNAIDNLVVQINNNTLTTGLTVSSYLVRDNSVNITITTNSCVKKDNLVLKQYFKEDGSLLSSTNFSITTKGFCSTINCLDEDQLNNLYKEIIKICGFCPNC